MDDAALRRGRRTSHSRFGMDVALLTAIALLNRAPMVIACCPDLEEPLRLRLIQLLSLATGDDDGLAAGQMADLQALQETTSTGQLRQIVLQKTAALFVYAVESGARIAGADAETISSMRKFAENFGLAFQILDDLADAHGSADQLKKDVGQDVRKATYASALGADGAKDLAQRHTSDAMRVLDAVGLADSPLARVAIETLNPSAIESLH
jgi:geranylgeranyl diphosphate synthase type II